ncbi:MAG: hypothetical protein AB7V46_00440 [Thermomicrobiales bacterium]
MTARSIRRVLIVMLVGAAFVIAAPGVTTQGTPEAVAANPFADLALPQIDITMTDDLFEGVPADLTAGRYVVALTVETTEEDGGGGTFLLMPEGMTTDQFIEFTAPSATPMAIDEAEASPMVEADASPAAEEGGDAPPPWYFETAMAGGPYADSGDTNYAVVDLSAGEWVFWAEYPGAPQAPQPISVTGEMPTDSPEPAPDVTIEMADFAFGFSTPLTAGQHIIALSNVGDQPHFLGVEGVPAGTTVDDVLALAEAEVGGMMGSPVATPTDGLSLEDLEPVFGTGDQSAGTTAWYEIELEPGTYVAACFVTDPETGLPHIMLGMVEVFEIS